LKPNPKGNDAPSQIIVVFSSMGKPCRIGNIHESNQMQPNQLLYYGINENLDLVGLKVFS
jgi:hypothetical protein